jgi:hypothetical protein
MVDVGVDNPIHNEVEMTDFPSTDNEGELRDLFQALAKASPVPSKNVGKVLVDERVLWRWIATNGSGTIPASLDAHTGGLDFAEFGCILRPLRMEIVPGSMYERTKYWAAVKDAALYLVHAHDNDRSDYNTYSHRHEHDRVHTWLTKNGRAFMKSHGWAYTTNLVTWVLLLLFFFERPDGKDLFDASWRLALFTGIEATICAVFIVHMALWIGSSGTQAKRSNKVTFCALIAIVVLDLLVRLCTENGDSVRFSRPFRPALFLLMNAEVRYIAVTLLQALPRTYSLWVVLALMVGIAAAMTTTLFKGARIFPVHLAGGTALNITLGTSYADTPNANTALRAQVQAELGIKGTVPELFTDRGFQGPGSAFLTFGTMLTTENFPGALVPLLTSFGSDDKAVADSWGSLVFGVVIFSLFVIVCMWVLHDAFLLAMVYDEVRIDHVPQLVTAPCHTAVHCNSVTTAFLSVPRYVPGEKEG